MTGKLSLFVSAVLAGVLVAVSALVFALEPAGEDVTADAAPGADPACVANVHATGLTTRSLESEGRVRAYSVHVPRSHAPDHAMPVVFDFHGSGSNPRQELAISGMSEAAEERGFIVVLPVAERPFRLGGFTWNVPRDAQFADDVRFVRDVLDDVSKRLCIDRTRIYVAGFSGGARLASRLACALSDRIAALAAVGGLRAPDDCARAVPVIAFHGTADPINPYDGGGPRYWGYGIDRALAGWVKENGCVGPAERALLGADVERLTYPTCAGGAKVELYRILGAGHVWPGSSFAFPPDRFGPMSNTTDATEVMLDFFEQQQLPSSAAESARNATTFQARE